MNKLIDRVLSIWTAQTPWTKRIVYIGGFLTIITLIVAAAMTGNLELLIVQFGGGDE